MGRTVLTRLCLHLLLLVQGGSAVYRGGVAGQGSGEGPGASSAQSFKVKIINHYAEEEVDVEVPEDRCGIAERSTEGWGRSSAPAHCSTRCCSACPHCSSHAAPCCRYILWAAEEQGYELPYACRLGCCTSCTVKVKEGEMFQPHSLGLSKSLRDQVGGQGTRAVRAMPGLQPDALRLCAAASARVCGGWPDDVFRPRSVGRSAQAAITLCLCCRAMH